MRAKLSSYKDMIIVSLSGRINMDYTDNFREALLNDIGHRSDKIIFNMEELSFVGSNGIIPFVNSLGELAQKQGKQLRFCSVCSEFQKIFAASSVANIQILENQEKAMNSLRNLDFIDNGAQAINAGVELTENSTAQDQTYAVVENAFKVSQSDS